MFKRILLTLGCVTGLSVAGFLNTSHAQVYYATPYTAHYAPYEYSYSPYPYVYNYQSYVPRYSYYGPRYYTAAPIYSAPRTYVGRFWR